MTVPTGLLPLSPAPPKYSTYCRSELSCGAAGAACAGGAKKSALRREKHPRSEARNSSAAHLPPQETNDKRSPSA